MLDSDKARPEVECVRTTLTQRYFEAAGCRINDTLSAILIIRL